MEHKDDGDTVCNWHAQYKHRMTWLVGFYGISTFVGYLTPNLFNVSNQFYFKQFSLV